MLTEITSENQYNNALSVIETYLKRGSDALTFDEEQELLRIFLLVEAYEQKVYPMPLPPQ